MSKENMYKVNFNKFAVRAENGTVDTTATVAKFQDELDGWLAGEVTNSEGIASAVAKVFEEAPAGARLSIQTAALVRRVLTDLNTPIEDTSAVQKKVQNFIKSSPDYVASRGSLGGVMRTVDAEKLAAEKAAKGAS